MNEREWVDSFADRLQSALATGMRLGTAQKLAYGAEIFEYGGGEKSEPNLPRYETDLLISEELGGSSWVPRVIVECKLGRITTHDALTYSAKAATHKHVHPYLRYGILIGHREHHAIPGRLVRHGAHFDFMATWEGSDPSTSEWQSFTRVVGVEVESSRAMQTLLATSRSSKRTKYTLLHRPLSLS